MFGERTLSELLLMKTDVCSSILKLNERPTGLANVDHLAVTATKQIHTEVSDFFQCSGEKPPEFGIRMANGGSVDGLYHLSKFGGRGEG